MLEQSGPVDFPDLSALQAGDIDAWNVAWPWFWPIALQAARHSKAGLLPWQAEDVASESIEELILRIETISSVQHAKALLTTIASRRGSASIWPGPADRA